jgi:hypothetical protein
MLKNSHCLDNRLTDGGKVVGLTHRPRSTPQKHYFSASGTHFCFRMSNPTGPSGAERIRYIEKFIHLIVSRTRDLLACGIAPQPLRYHVPHHSIDNQIKLKIRHYKIFIYIRK